jgi:uncharacterized Zn finger protein
MAWEYGGWRPYVSVAKRRANAAREVARRAKKGQKVSPVRVEGRTIANTFWGKAWCENLEAYSDYENRLPRGRTYVRNGSVVDLQIAPGKVTALVMGSSLYEIEIAIEPMKPAAWKAIASECTGRIDSLVELLAGKLSSGVMEVMTRKGKGLFPAPREISLDCSCPDYADLCKHLAAVLYGVGARLDEKPELLFVLRNVDHMDLIAQAGDAPAVGRPAKGKTLAAGDLSGIFGIELDPGTAAPAAAPKSRRTKKKTTTITAKELVAQGISRSLIQSWLSTDVLTRTKARGVYGKTEEAERRIAARRAAAPVTGE